VVLSHGIQSGIDGPVLNYGNQAALSLWKASWEELTTMPSKYTAEDLERTAREAFLKEVNEKNIIQNYSGVRIALDKSRFIIKSATVWNIIVDGVKLGQAATFESFDRLPSTDF
jgi:hypothetical protein